MPSRLVGSRVIVKAGALDDGLEIYAGDELVASHLRVGKGQRAICEEHVAALRRPRFERLRERARAVVAAAPPCDLRALVQWPRVDVALRPIADYAAAVGGAQ